SGDTTTTTTYEAGENKIQGLKGEYTITETQAPKDYSSLMLRCAVVSFYVDDTNLTWSLYVKSDPNNLFKK
ncbi:SpaA isopeptide-forming pilin-related protein, partial [Bifidobacterium pseudocatenulatum]|uniref:SpaA isopeptide-forming pilin-related protein n=1 Tax=Bifidobacterium pseudocatenulatum TaxID=28026 RepID=UPI0021094C35